MLLMDEVVVVKAVMELREEVVVEEVVVVEGVMEVAVVMG